MTITITTPPSCTPRVRWNRWSWVRSGTWPRPAPPPPPTPRLVAQPYWPQWAQRCDPSPISWSPPRSSAPVATCPEPMSAAAPPVPSAGRACEYGRMCYVNVCRQTERVRRFVLRVFLSNPKASPCVWERNNTISSIHPLFPQCFRLFCFSHFRNSQQFSKFRKKFEILKRNHDFLWLRNVCLLLTKKIDLSNEISTLIKRWRFTSWSMKFGNYHSIYIYIHTHSRLGECEDSAHQYNQIARARALDLCFSSECAWERCVKNARERLSECVRKLLFPSHFWLIWYRNALRKETTKAGVIFVLVVNFINKEIN